MAKASSIAKIALFIIFPPALIVAWVGKAIVNKAKLPNSNAANVNPATQQTPLESNLRKGRNFLYAFAALGAGVLGLSFVGMMMQSAQSALLGAAVFAFPAVAVGGSVYLYKQNKNRKRAAAVQQQARTFVRPQPTQQLGTNSQEITQPQATNTASVVGPGISGPSMKVIFVTSHERT